MTRTDCYFLLKEPKSDSPTLIYFFLQCPDGKVKRSVQRKIHPGNWDFDNKRPKKDRELDRYLDSFVQMEEDIKSDCRRNKVVISASMVNEAIDILLQDSRPVKTIPEPVEASRNLITDYLQIIEAMKSGAILTPGKNKKKYEHKSITYFTRVVNTIKGFYQEKGLPPTHESINQGLYNQFIAWSHTKNFANSYIGATIKGWKRLSGIARKDFGFHGNSFTETKEFLKIGEEAADIFLTEKQIERIYQVELDEPHYQLARDWFVLDCYMGLRVSDLLRITEKDFEGYLFQFINKKTGAKVALPVHSFVREIIHKYGGIPPKITDVKLNKYIKQVAKKAKLQGNFIYTITKGGRLETRRVKEWEMVSSHTARRSFITNLLKIGVPHAQVMSLTGIKRYETLMRYFKQSAKQVAEDVAKHEFFTGRPGSAL